MKEENNIILFKTKLNKYISNSDRNDISEDERKYYKRMISKLKADIFVEEYKLTKIKSRNKNNY